MRNILFISAIALTPLLPAQHQMPTRIDPDDSPLAIKVRLDGEYVHFEGAAPVMAGSRVLVPLRGLFERMGATVSWSQAQRTVSIQHDDKVIELPIGKMQARVDDQSLALDQPAMVLNGHTFVPLRFIGETLGAKVKWL
jgi:hypothetical protein